MLTGQPFELLFFIAAAFGARVLASITGFGVSTILLPIAALFFDIKIAIGLVGLFHLLGEAADSLLWRRNINWRVVLTFSVLGVVFSYLGATLVTFLPSRLITALLGAFLVIYSLFSLSGRSFALPKNNLAVAGAGGLVGFLAGVIGTAGALRSVVLAALGLSKAAFIATSSMASVLVDGTRVGVYLTSGILQVSWLWWIPMLVVAVLGSWLGKKLALKIREKSFFKVVYAALLLAGIKFILG